MGGVERKIDGMVVVVGRCTGDVVFACSFVRSFVRSCACVVGSQRTDDDDEHRW